MLTLLAACGSPTPGTTAPAQTTGAITSSVASPTLTSSDYAQALAKAFAAKDANSVERLLSGQTAIGVSAVVEPVQPGDPDRGNCCVLTPSVVSFVNELRGKFADGSLTVIVDPQLRPAGANDPGPFLLTSDWREPDRTTRIDLYLRDIGGVWRWTQALHHYPRSAATGTCIVHYRPPWVPTGTITHGC